MVKNMSDLIIKRLNSSFIKIISEEESIHHDIDKLFRFETPNFFKRRGSFYDGIVRLYNKRTKQLPYGLLVELLKHCKKRGWDYEVDDGFKEEVVDVTLEEITDWVKELGIVSKDGELIDVYDYQIEAIYVSIKFGRLTLLAATNAGKSLIMYCLCRYYLMHPDPKVILVVPTKALVDQMFNDFKEYSSKNGWDVSANVHQILGGREKISNKPIYISTYHSIRDMDKDYFEEVTNLLIDECHGSDSKSIQKICDGTVNASSKIGMTGTLKADIIHPLMVQSRLGRIYRVVTVKQLQDSGRATKTKIVRVLLKYSGHHKKNVFKTSYQEEIDYIIQCEPRNEIIKKFARNTKNNTLLMFRFKDRHLVELFEQLESESDSTKKYFMYTGDTSLEEKEAIKQYVETHDDAVVLGTEGSISTGISIKNLHNFAFCHPLKSSIRVLQSIGRMLRLHKDKEYAVIFDFVDDFSTNSWKNAALEHSYDRISYYKAEGLEYKTMEKEIR